MFLCASVLGPPCLELGGLSRIAEGADALLCFRTLRQRHFWETSQLFVARLVDTFQTFLEEFLREVFVAQPGLLKRADPVSMEEVLSHKTLQSFTETAIERRILKLAYKSFRDLRNEIQKDLTFQLVVNGRDAARLERLFDVRNLITHNYGIINKFFLSRHPGGNLVLGEPYPMALEEMGHWYELLFSTSLDCDFPKPFPHVAG